MKYNITDYTEEQIKEKFGVDKETFEKIREDIELKCGFSEISLLNLETKYSFLKTGRWIIGILTFMMCFSAICLYFCYKRCYIF